MIYFHKYIYIVIAFRSPVHACARKDLEAPTVINVHLDILAGQTVNPADVTRQEAEIPTAVTEPVTAR